MKIQKVFFVKFKFKLLIRNSRDVNLDRQLDRDVCSK